MIFLFSVHLSVMILSAALMSPTRDSWQRDRVLPPPLINDASCHLLVWLILFPDLILIRLNAATRCYAEGFYASGVSYNRERTARTWQPCNHFIILMGGQLYGSNDDMTLEICWIAPISDWMEINTEEKQVSCGPLKSQLLALLENTRDMWRDHGNYITVTQT